MALSGKKYGKDLVFKLDTQAGVLKDISAYVQSVNGLPGENDMGDVTGGGSTGYRWLRGLPKAEFNIVCVFDDAVDSAYDVVKNFMSDTTTRSFEYGPAGSTAGYVKIYGECQIPKIDFDVKTIEPLMIAIYFKLDGADTIGVWT